MGKEQQKPINLALQGGGSHGAFTWGVLDRLLEEEKLPIEGISGASAGAMNAVVLAAGLANDGNDPAQAKDALEQFWRAVSDAAALSPIKRNPINVMMGDFSFENSPTYVAFDLMSRIFSPYQLNLSGDNHLRRILDSVVDWDRLTHCTTIKLFISATNVHTGRVRVFKTHEVTTDTILASACLPQLFKAVEIDGIPYWDGGFAGNPPLYPFFDTCSTRDLLLVQINPMTRTETPKTAHGIQNRVNEITFNQSLMKEFRAIEFVSRLIEEGKLDPNEYAHVRLHRIASEEALLAHDSSSKLNAEWDFLLKLKEIGREAAEKWLKTCFPHVGEKATVDIRKLFA